MSGLQIDELLSERGRRVLRELSEESITSETELALLTRFRASYPAAVVASALSQVKLRRRARAKFSRADEMLFTQAGLEQASTEAMAKHHAERFARFDRVADLCSGIGGDLIGLAAVAQTTAVDFDPIHSRLGLFNAGVYGVSSRVNAVCDEVRAVDLSGVQAAFVDPARRSAERRFRGGESEPPLAWCFALASRMDVAIKAAPGLPLDVVPAGWEVEFVSEHHELKESLLLSPALATSTRRATLLPSGQTMIARTGASLRVQEPGVYLLDPDPSVTRAGVVAELGESLGAWKIDEQVAFLSSMDALETPFARTLRVEASQPWSLKTLKEALRSLDVGTVDIRKRGSAVDVEDIQRRLKLGGSRAATVVLTRVADRPWAFVCFAVRSASVLDVNAD